MNNEVSGNEPNEVPEEETKNQEMDSLPDRETNDSPKAPSGLSGIKAKAKTSVNTTLKVGVKAVFRWVSAVLPTPIKIALIALIVFIILVIVAVADETDKTATTVTGGVNSYVNSSSNNTTNNSTLNDEQKDFYKKNASLIKFSLNDINNIYDEFNNSKEYTTKVKKGFNYILGTNEIKESTSGESSGQSSTTKGNGTWDQGGLENVKMDVPGEEKNFTVTFYTNLPTDENSSTRMATDGSALTFGMIASNNIDIGKKVLLEGHGVYTVADKDLEGLNSDTDIAIFIPQKANESSDDYKKRVEGYNKQTIKGKIISVDDYSEYIYSSTGSGNSNYEWDIGGLTQYDYASLQGEEIEFDLSFYCGTNDSMEGGAKGADNNNILVYGNVASNYWSNIVSLGNNKWDVGTSGRTFGTKIYLEGIGTFTVEDRGGSFDFNKKNRIDVFIPRRDGESDSAWRNRTNSYGHVKIKGKVLPTSYDAHQHGS